MKRAILVFLKFPEPGRVKTRLAASLGDEGAAEAYRLLVKRVFAQCIASSPDTIALAYDPSSRESEVREWLAPALAPFEGELVWIPQSSGDLGDRLEKGTESLFTELGEAKVAVIGTDCVHLDPVIWETLWNSVQRDSDVTFGPTEDGGYYLVGFQRFHPALFREIPWSAENTLSASIVAAESVGLSVKQLPVRLDVDTIDEWKKVEPELSEA